MISADTRDSVSSFERAMLLACQTSQSFFLTGKAGTGKTTFLHSLRNNCPKKLAVVAPTGIAAINAGGVTIHSFFQLPLGPFVPVDRFFSFETETEVFTPSRLLKDLKLTDTKKQIIQELELLVIDEVSMLRCDTVDAIDLVLRHTRNKMRLPFGGVQVLFIGDLYQLPPVLRDQDKRLLDPFYEGPFFFQSKVLSETPLPTVELTKIYRQSDPEFLNLLNKIRNNEVEQDDLKSLHRYYDPDFVPSQDDHYIVLTTHNHRADAVNEQELARLPGKCWSIEADITGDFNEKWSPAEIELKLKVGAQIMFIRNDKGEFRRYYNGKLATVTHIDEERIEVELLPENKRMDLERETWRNIRYRYNAQKDEIEEEELGTLTQYPVRLAWAITIHKSQGLTFQKAVVDAGNAFAPGQVYVALSRLTSLDGLVLKSTINPTGFQVNEEVAAFMEESRARATDFNAEDLRMQYLVSVLRDCFGLGGLNLALSGLGVGLFGNGVDEQESGLSMQWIKEKLFAWNEHIIKFNNQLEQIVLSPEPDLNFLKERLNAAVGFFLPGIRQLQSRLRDSEEIKASPRKLKKAVDKLLLEAERFAVRMEKVGRIAASLNTDFGALMQTLQAPTPVTEVETVSGVKSIGGKRGGRATQKRAAADGSGTGASKEASWRETLVLFREGVPLEEIAEKRRLAFSTIQGHLAKAIGQGELKVEEWISADIIEKIENVLNQSEEGLKLTEIKSRLPEEVGYGQIRAVIASREKAL